jgi:ferrochelatase
MPKKTGVLLIQLGTPDAPTVAAVRRYLRQFLGDPRVIEAPRLLWWLILHAQILPARPARSAAKYQRIWHPETGSPLLRYTRLQAERLQEQLAPNPVRFAMQVGNPSVAKVVRELIEAGADRLIVMPMYPQYSATTTASALDALFQALMKERRVPTLRVVPPYYEHHAYIGAVTAVIRETLSRLTWEPEHYIISFHGIPLKYVERGDPYPTHVARTTELLIEKLGWTREMCTGSFQSLFGKDIWLQPYTEDVLRRLGNRGVKRVFVATPGFTTDCLETIDEIGFEGREVFRHAGGEELVQCPCLNDHPAWIAAMKTMIEEEGQGWLT